MLLVAAPATAETFEPRQRQRVRPAVGSLPARAANDSLAAIGDCGHALTKRQVLAGGPCPLCKAQGLR